MRNELTTKFWKNALAQLPPEIQSRHVHDIEAAERWELRLNALIKIWTHAKIALGRMFQTPRSAH
jgi:hypothetical protein